mgnify:CR=1 FL=1
MACKPYKDYEKRFFEMPDRPYVLKIVDTIHGIIYLNQDAAGDAKVVILVTEYSAGFCAC